MSRLSSRLLMEYEPAFPVKVQNSDGSSEVHVGISARDYFALKCLPVVVGRVVAGRSDEELARDAYNLAEAMMAERDERIKADLERVKQEAA